jgi:hypothetical protein
VPLQGSLTVSNVVALPAFLASSAASFAALISVPPAQVYAVNVSDIATGASVVVGSIRRQLAGAGSKGVSVTYVARLGKTPTESSVANISAVLASPTLAASTLRSVAAQLGAATQLGAAAFAISVPAAGVVVANAPFTFGATVVIASSSSDSGGAAGGAAAGGIVGAIALACAIWAFRSWKKHGQLPCCRNRKREMFAARDERLEAEETARAIAEAEAQLEAASPPQKPTMDVSSAFGNGSGVPRKPKGDKNAALTVRKLAKRSADAEKAAAAAAAEVAELKRLLAAAKGETTQNPAFGGAAGGAK